MRKSKEKRARHSTRVGINDKNYLEVIGKKNIHKIEGRMQLAKQVSREVSVRAKKEEKSNRHSSNISNTTRLKF
jgi:hypothetical protein